MIKISARLMYRQCQDVGCVAESEESKAVTRRDSRFVKYLTKVRLSYLLRQMKNIWDLAHPSGRKVDNISRSAMKSQPQMHS